MKLTVNGNDYDIEVEPRRTLVEALRHECGLTGTHVGCEHGVCGACTVIMDGAPVRACLVFAVQAEGAALRTVEGLAGTPLQDAFIAHHGLQCGFCTPGFLMLATALLDRDPAASDATIIDALSSNLCRCTGYAGIVAAVLAARDEAAVLAARDEVAVLAARDEAAVLAARDEVAALAARDVLSGTTAR